MNRLFRKTGRALAAVPDAAARQAFMLEAAWSLPLAALMVHAGGLAQPGAGGDPAMLFRLAAVAILMPALGEELLFRVILLPAPAERAPRWRYALPVVLFVLWHPPQALLFGPHWGAVVLNPFFLAAVAVLGTALTRLYLRTGSIWPCVLLHWLAVVAWKALLGGPSPWVGG